MGINQFAGKPIATSTYRIDFVMYIEIYVSDILEINSKKF